MEELRAGQNIAGYTVKSVCDLAEYESRGILLEHDRTGCEVYHLVNDDEENAFSFNFTTPPSDSKGTAHIIEHAVLSGSQSFPLKDPFAVLMKGTMSTFLNAMTYPDKTLYPAASTVEKDFFNLLRVYGDAVFFPLLRREVFHQEGRRIELDESGRIIVQGVVYNEMIGNYSTHESIAGEWSYRSLFPDTVYIHDSGGMPEEIRDLSYEEFRAFHKRYYHPGNCRVFLYGRIATERTLRFLDEHFLSRFGRQHVDTTIRRQPRWSKPVTLRKTSPHGESETDGAGTTITMNWLADSIHDPLAVLSLEVLTEILMGNPGAPLQKAIVDSRLGEDLSPVSGLDTHTLEMVFSVGLRGTDEDRRANFESLVMRELGRLASEGISGDAVDAAVRRVEFSNREIRGGSPFGLRLLAKMLRGWIHGTAPETTLEFARHMEELKRRAAERGYFESLIRRLFLDNPHRSTVVIVPDETHDKKLLEDSNRWAAALKRSMSDADRRRIEDDLSRFRAFQSTPDRPEDLQSVPSLSIDDVPREVERIDTQLSDIAGIPVHSLELFTNGITYIDFAFDVEDIDGESLMLLPYLACAIPGAGLPGVPYDEVARQLAIKTGGFTSFLETSTVVGGDSSRSFLMARVKALDSDLDEALDLVLRLLCSAELSDGDRMRDILLEFRNDAKAQILPSGHSFASLRAGSNLSPVLMREEQWRGLDQYRYLCALAADPGKALEPALEALRRLRDTLVCRSRLTVNLCAGGESMGAARRALLGMLDALPQGSAASGERAAVPARRLAAGESEAFQVPSSVGYVALAAEGSRFEEPGHASEVLLAHLLKTDVLWELVRMQGGAYGVFASPNGGEGVFTFTSYRDPRIVETLDAYRRGLEHYAGPGLTQPGLEQAIIGVVGRDVRPMSPSEKSMTGFRRSLYNISDELRQRKRDSLVGSTPRDIRETAERLLSRMDSSVSVVLAGKLAIEHAAGVDPSLGVRVESLPL